MMTNSLIYKDEFPEKTIENFRKFLLERFDLTERCFVSEIEGIYSYRLEIKGSGIGTNGKGTSLEFARASAYGEFIERLSNIMLIKASCSEIPKARFDVVKRPSFSFLSSNFLQNFKNNINYLTKLNFVKNNSRDFCYAIPYKNITSGIVEYIPSFFLSFYGSNGMAAGNSFYEMSVQALSEIFERYVIKKIVDNRETVFLYSNDDISDIFPEIGNCIRQIQSAGYSVKIYDCSFGLELPCYAVAFFSEDGGYSVSFGAHPLSKYAILRCFTEINQGFEKIFLKSERNKICFSDYYNLRRIFHNGFGVYPEQFLNETRCSSNRYLLTKNYSSNKEMYEFCINKILDLGFEIFYHDASYLGFPSGHYIVPGMSDIFIPNEEHLRFLECKKKWFPRFNDFLQLSSEERKLILELYDYFFNTHQYEVNIKYVSNYSENSDVNLFLFMVLGFSIIRKKKQSQKYLDLLLKAKDFDIDREIISKLLLYMDTENIDLFEKILINGKFKRCSQNYDLADKYFPVLLDLQKKYYK